MDSYYPLFASLENKICVVVGGGQVAERKVRRLLECGATVNLIAQHLTPWLEEKRRAGLVCLISRSYEDFLIDHADLVFAATDSPDLNRRIARYAARKRIWCNSATDPEESSFLVPAVVRRGPLSIAISTSGLSPAAARKIRLQLEEQFGKEWERYLGLLGALRKAIHTKRLESEENQRIFRNLVELPLLEWIRQGRRTEVLGAISRICQSLLSEGEITEIWDEAWKVSS